MGAICGWCPCGILKLKAFHVAENRFFNFAGSLPRGMYSSHPLEHHARSHSCGVFPFGVGAHAARSAGVLSSPDVFDNPWTTQGRWSFCRTLFRLPLNSVGNHLVFCVAVC